MAPKRLALAAVVALAAAALASCADDDGGDDAAEAPSATGGCPVAAATVAAAVGHGVAIERGNEDGVCAYVGEEGGATAGARVEVQVLDLAERPYGEALAAVEQRAGPAELLADGAVDGAERGWVAGVGRAVQVGAADDERLVIVAVTDPLLDAVLAREVAIDLAEEALDG